MQKITHFFSILCLCTLFFLFVGHSSNIFSISRTFEAVQIYEYSNFFMVFNKIVNNINFSLIKWLLAFYTEFIWCKCEEIVSLKISSQDQVLKSSAEDQCHITTTTLKCLESACNNSRI